MKKSAVNEAVLLFVLLSYLSFLFMGLGSFGTMRTIPKIIFCILVVFCLLNDYLLQFFMWTGEDKTSYDINKNNQSHILVWLCMLVIYSVAALISLANAKYILLESGLLLMVYLYIRVYFAMKGERNYFENHDYIKKFSANISFLLYSRILLVSILVWLFAEKNLYFVIPGIAGILFSLLVKFGHLNGENKNVNCIESIIFIVALLMSTLGMFFAKVAGNVPICFAVFFAILLVLCFGIKTIDDNNRN